MMITSAIITVLDKNPNKEIHDITFPTEPYQFWTSESTTGKSRKHTISLIKQRNLFKLWQKTMFMLDPIAQGKIVIDNIFL